MLGVFASFGQATSIVIGIYFVYRCIIFVLTHIVRAGTLYSVIGCSWKIFACVADAFTTCVIGRALHDRFKRQVKAPTPGLELLLPPETDGYATLTVPGEEKTENGKSETPSAPLDAPEAIPMMKLYPSLVRDRR